MGRVKNSLTFYYIYDYASLKQAVRKGATYEEVIFSASKSPKHVIEDLYNRAKEEIWFEDKVKKTKIGKLLYD